LTVLHVEERPEQRVLGKAGHNERKGAYKMRIELPLAPSQKELQELHWARREKLKKEFAWLIVQAVGNRSSVLNGVHITITLKTYGAELDSDKLAAPAKLILDALQRAGIIKDDDSKRISVTICWEQAKKEKEQRVLVEIKKWDLEKLSK
jgi:hypothetical protein|tara:strand:- start:1423 stop:1872 length:450 start_codon:yes stop_codon:yes gene_type:complete